MKIKCCNKKGFNLDKALLITRLATSNQFILNSLQKDFYVLSILKLRDEHLINAMLRNGLTDFKFRDGRSIMEFLCKHKMTYAIDTFLDIEPEKIASTLKYIYKYNHLDLLYHFSQKASSLEHKPLITCASKFSNRKGLSRLMNIIKRSNEAEKYKEIKSFILYDHKLKSVF